MKAAMAGVVAKVAAAGREGATVGMAEAMEVGADCHATFS